MTHQDNSTIATYCTADGTPQYETHFALITMNDGKGLLCAFPTPEIRGMAVEAAFTAHRHAQAVNHHDAFQMAHNGAAMWFRLDSGEMAPLSLNRRRGVPAPRLVEVSSHG